MSEHVLLENADRLAAENGDLIVTEASTPDAVTGGYERRARGVKGPTEIIGAT